MINKFELLKFVEWISEMNIKLSIFIFKEQMIKAKQSEREAKRLEGDIKKERRQLQHSIRELDVG